jgi:alpha-1,3-mannosyl-glycoprotein beta-1,2-N-acetylglucosaminyltransferase
MLRGNPYQWLAIHYGWALRMLFDGKAYNEFPLPERVIILEEDLRIAPDFFEYFEATAPLLDRDPTLLAVSAFNDNGFQGQVADPKRLLRSDFFPGLGFSFTRNTWVSDIGPKWPGGYWDDWLREPAQRQGRQFIRPEITRTFHFGEKGGASHGQFGANHQRIMLNTEKVDWEAQDLSYLEPDSFKKIYAQMVSNAKPVQSKEEALEQVKQGSDARIEYRGGIPDMPD